MYLGEKNNLVDLSDMGGHYFGRYDDNDKHSFHISGVEAQRQQDWNRPSDQYNVFEYGMCYDGEELHQGYFFAHSEEEFDKKTARVLRMHLEEIADRKEAYADL